MSGIRLCIGCERKAVVLFGLASEPVLLFLHGRKICAKKTQSIEIIAEYYRIPCAPTPDSKACCAASAYHTLIHLRSKLLDDVHRGRIRRGSRLALPPARGGKTGCRRPQHGGQCRPGVGRVLSRFRCGDRDRFLVQGSEEGG